MPSETPQIALVVSSYNRSHRLTRLFSLLEAQSLEKAKWEAIVCDDGSSDNSLKVLSEYQSKAPFNLRFFSQDNQGQTVGRHNGILRSNAKYIVIVDDDMEFEADFLESYLKAFTEHPSKVIIGRVIPRDDWQSFPMYEAMREHQITEVHSAIAAGHTKPTGTHFITQNVAFPRDLYLEVGGFDATLQLYEDCELGWRFEKHGAEFTFSSEASAVHQSNIGSFNKWFNRHFQYGKYAVYIWQKYENLSALHPLRNFVTGSALYRWLFLAIMWNESVTKLMANFLAIFGKLLNKVGLNTLGLYAYRALQNLQFNRGILAEWGTERFRIEYRSFLMDKNRPTYPLGSGPVFEHS